MLCNAQLSWAGHVGCVSDERLPKKIVYGELKHGKRGRQETLSKRVIHWSCKLGVPWRSSIHVGAVVFEENRISKVIQKRAKR